MLQVGETQYHTSKSSDDATLLNENGEPTVGSRGISTLTRLTKRKVEDLRDQLSVCIT